MDKITTVSYTEAITKLKEEKVNPYAASFAYIDEQRILKLGQDIKTNGLRNEIERYKGEIIDGQNRFIACTMFGITPKYRDVDTDISDPKDYVVSANLHRRHLNPSQRAWAAMKMAKLSDMTQEDAAKLLDASLRNVNNASVVNDEGTEILQTAVQNGKLPVSVACRMVKLNELEQKELLNLSKKARVERLRFIERSKESEKKLPAQLNFDKKTISEIMTLAKNSSANLPTDKSDFKRLVTDLLIEHLQKNIDNNNTQDRVDSNQTTSEFKKEAA